MGGADFALTPSLRKMKINIKKTGHSSSRIIVSPMRFLEDVTQTLNKISHKITEEMCSPTPFLAHFGWKAGPFT